MCVCVCVCVRVCVCPLAHEGTISEGPEPSFRKGNWVKGEGPERGRQVLLEREELCPSGKESCEQEKRDVGYKGSGKETKHVLMWDISQGGGRGFLQGPALLLETIHPAKEGNQVCSGLWCSIASFPVFFAKAFLDVPLPLPHTLPLRLPSHLPVGDGQWVKAGRAGSSCCSRKHQLWGSVVRNPIEIPKTIPKGTLVPFEDFLMHFFLNPHTGPSKSHAM